MNAPHIQYAASADGTKIAYTIVGAGPPLLLLDAMNSAGIEARLASKRFGPFYRALAMNRSLVLFDWRSTGISGKPKEISLDLFVADLESVISGLRPGPIDVWALGCSCHVALEFAAVRPELLRKLVLEAPRPAGSSPRNSQEIEPVSDLASSNWDYYTEAYALMNYGWEDIEFAREFLNQMRANWTPQTYADFWDLIEGFDCISRSSQVQAVTLVIQEQGRVEPQREVSRRIAGLLPRGQLVSVPGSRSSGRAPAVDIIEAFLGAAEEEVRPAPPQPEIGLFRTILFTDVEGHTPMMQRLGDAKGREVLREHESITREALKDHGGAEVKTMGDGFMASFTSATRAIACAVALQRAFAERNEKAAEPLKVRVGLNAGEPIAEEEDLFGSSVILAARIAAQAKGGEVLVANVVRELVAGKGFLLADRGETALRGFEDTVRLYELRWSDDVGRSL